MIFVALLFSFLWTVNYPPGMWDAFANRSDVGGYGCQISQKERRWEVEVWARPRETSVEHFRFLLASESSRSAALKDCDRWMAEADKFLKERKKHQ